KSRAVVSRKNAAGVFPCGAAELDIVCQAECAPHRSARRISHVHGAGFSREPRPIPLSEQSGRAGSPLHAANSVQARTAATRPKSRRARGTAANAFFEIREKH